jgi:hypothetical protein
MSTMRLLVGLAVFGAAVVGGAWLAVSLVMGTTSLGCPTALLEGTLVEQDGTLAVQSPYGGRPVTVAWPFGYAVERRDGELVLTRVFGVVARAGDDISVGGGEGGAEADFRGCGVVTLGLLEPPPPSPSPRATLVVTATAAGTCATWPGGCGYAVTLTGASGDTSRGTFADSRRPDAIAKGIRGVLAVGPGLPLVLAPGTYRIAFEADAYGDVVSFDDKGKEILFTPAGTCAATITVPELADDHVVVVRAAFDASDCAIEATRFVDPSTP